MPQPLKATSVPDELIRMFQTAQADIEAQLATITEGRRAVRLRELQRTVTVLLDELESETRLWIEQSLPTVYAFGAGDAATIIGDSFVWTQTHIEALNALARTAWDDMLSSTRFVRRDTKAWIRDEVRQQATLSLIEGLPARQAGRALANAAGNELGIFTVTYKNGSKVRLADYGDMALRTVTANAYAEGTINQSRESGVETMECIDNPECGFSSHDDPDKPNGRVFSIDEAASAPISHPRCVRSWIPRIDVAAKDITKATSIRDPAAMADQAQSFELRTGRAPREPRSSRTPRTPRTAAQPTTGVAASSVLSSRPGAARSDVGREVERGLNAIERVHRVPEGMRPVPVQASDARSYFGQYSYRRGPNGTPTSIRVARHGDHKASTFAHEFGHYLDHQALGPQAGTWATRNLAADSPLHQWAKAIDASPSVQALRALPRPDSVTRYYQRADELWARSYAQYIATRSADSAMLKEMVAIRADNHAGRALSQWGTAEFEPIAKAIDGLLSGLGLLV